MPFVNSTFRLNSSSSIVASSCTAIPELERIWLLLEHHGPQLVEQLARRRLAAAAMGLFAPGMGRVDNFIDSRYLPERNASIACWPNYFHDDHFYHAIHAQAVK